MRRTIAQVTFSERRDKELLSAPGTMIVPPGPGPRQFWSSVILSALLAAFFWFGSQAVIRADRSAEAAPARVAQQEERAMSYALHARKYQAGDPEAGVSENFLRWLPHATDGIMQPLWPWMASRLTESEHPQPGFDRERDRRLVERGRKVHLWLAAGFLLVCGIIAARAFSPAATVAALLPAAMAVLLPDGLWFRPDLLHWVLVFFSWVCALRLLRRNSVWLHGVFGVVSGLAWLTDGTALIVPAAWLVAATARWVTTSLRRGEQPVHETWVARHHFVGLVALLFGWIAVCGPRCGAAMDFWGRPLFTWQQTWMWFDNAEEGREFTLRYNDAKDVAGRRVPLPGWDFYHERHTTEQAKGRLTAGWGEVWREFLGLEGAPGEDSGVRSRLAARRGVWLGGAAVLFATAGLIALFRRPPPGKAQPPASGAGALFVALAMAGYGLWFGWYRPIESDSRLMLVIYLPLVWSLVRGAEKLMTLAKMRGAPPVTYRAWQFLAWTLNAAVAIDAFLLLRGSDLLAPAP